MAPYTQSKKKVRFINPPNILKQKVGHGGINPKLIDEAQDFIKKNDFDFTAHARKLLKEMASTLARADFDKGGFEQAREKIVVPVMQLKASGGMFNYQLVSDVADIALQFLEAVEEINQDVIHVLKAHENTISVIMDSKLTGDGGNEGYELVKELDKACSRYFSKHKK